MPGPKGKTRHAPLAIGLALTLVAVPATAQDPLEPSEERLVKLDSPAETLAFIGGDRLLLIGNEAGRLQLLDIASGEVEREISYGETWLGGVAFTDVDAAPDRATVYLVGESLEERSTGLVTRLQLESGATETILFENEFRSPSVTVSGASQDRRIFIGDLNSNTVTVVDDWLFEKLSGQKIDRADLGKNIYLNEGAAVDLEVSNDGRFIVASHGNTLAISLIDTQYLEQIDRLVPGKGAGGYPYAIRIAAGTATHSNDGRSSLVLAKLAEDVLMLLDIDPDFQNFELVTITELGLNSRPSLDLPSSPLLLAVAENMASIVVGSREESHVVVFSRQDDALVGRYVVELGEPPRSIDVSPEGDTVAILGADGRTLKLVGNPLAWARQAAGGGRSQRVAQVQRLLASIGYPVGVVDGFEGPNTRHAVAEFQYAADAQATGVIDEKTLALITAVSAEGGPDAASETLPVEQRCSTRKKLQPMRSRSTDRQFEERICAAEDRSDHPIQIDRYRISRANKPSYSSTVFHSCAFIRFTKTDAYLRFCR